MTETVSPTHRHKPESDRSPTHPLAYPIYSISWFSCSITYLSPSLSIVMLFILPNFTVWLSIGMRAKPVTFTVDSQSCQRDECNVTHHSRSPLATIIVCPCRRSLTYTTLNPPRRASPRVSLPNGQNECDRCDAGPMYAPFPSHIHLSLTS